MVKLGLHFGYKKKSTAKLPWQVAPSIRYFEALVPMFLQVYPGLFLKKPFLQFLPPELELHRSWMKSISSVRHPTLHNMIKLFLKK